MTVNSAVNTTRAIILAAGKGSRLNGMTDQLPKCLAQVGELSLIERQIRRLRAEGIAEIGVVVGFAADRVKQALGRDLIYIENERYAETNSLFSLWLARDLLHEGFVVLNADVLFHPQMLKDLLSARYEDALLVSYVDEFGPALGEEEMKVKVTGGKVIDISKTLDPGTADGENVGIAKFGSDGAGLLIDKMNELVQHGEDREWAPRAFKGFAAEKPLYAIGTRGYPWIEIDFPEDYRRAIDEIFPRIAGVNAVLGARN